MGDLNGSWEFELDFIRGQAKHSAQLELEGEVVTGRYRSQYGEQEIRGKIQGKQIEMRVGIHYQACGCSYGFKGTVEGDVIKGEVDLGEYWKGSWEARKVG